MTWNRLLQAILRDEHPLSEELLDRYIGTLTEAGSTPLHFAMTVGNLDTVRQLLLFEPLLIHRHNLYKETPLHWACKLGNASLVSELISAGASVHVCDTEDNTPLHWAAEYDQTEIVQVLLWHGASRHALNSEGLTPRGVAQFEGVSRKTRRMLSASPTKFSSRLFLCT